MTACQSNKIIGTWQRQQQPMCMNINTYETLELLICCCLFSLFLFQMRLIKPISIFFYLLKTNFNWKVVISTNWLIEPENQNFFIWIKTSLPEIRKKNRTYFHWKRKIKKLEKCITFNTKFFFCLMLSFQCTNFTIELKSTNKGQIKIIKTEPHMLHNQNEFFNFATKFFFIFFMRFNVLYMQ